MAVLADEEEEEEVDGLGVTTGNLNRGFFGLGAVLGAAIVPDATATLVSEAAAAGVAEVVAEGVAGTAVGPEGPPTPTPHGEATSAFVTGEDETSPPVHRGSAAAPGCGQ